MPRGPILIVKTDLSSARIIAPGASREWTAPALPDDRPPTVREAKARAAAAASWIARDPNAKRRIDAIYTDVDESMCIWMRATSPARPVVAAQLRAMAQEWGSDASVLAVEPLRNESSPAPRRARTAKASKPEDDAPEADAPPDQIEPAGFAVIALPDAMTRLLVNAADAGGTRIGMVATVWHLMAEVGAPTETEGVVGIVSIDATAGRLLWAWADASGLIAGGAARIDAETPETTHRRVALDWLTWAAQLGRCPARIVVIGESAKEWSGGLARAWQDVPATLIETTNPMAALIERASKTPTTPHKSGRRSLARITHRPTRATRSRYQIAGAALALLLVATSSVAFRMWQKTTQWSEIATQVRQESIAAVRQAWPEQTKTQQMTNPRRVAETLRETELRESKPFEAPPRPRPILEEAVRIASILASRDTDFDDGVPLVRLTQLVLDQERTNALAFVVPDRQIATELVVALNTDAIFMLWERAAQSPNPNAPNLMGTWTKEAE